MKKRVCLLPKKLELVKEQVHSLSPEHSDNALGGGSVTVYTIFTTIVPKPSDGCPVPPKSEGSCNCPPKPGTIDSMVPENNMCTIVS